MSGSDGGNEQTADGQSSIESVLRERDWRTTLIGILQWTVALAAFWYLGQDLDLQATLTGLSTLGPAVIVAVLVITTLEFGSRFSMWHVLLNGRNQTSFEATVQIDLVIKFVNQIVPSKASGHIVTPPILRYYTDTDWTEAVSIAGLNTGLYASLYGLVALTGLAIFAARLASGWVVVILLSTSTYLAAGGLIMIAGRQVETVSSLADRLGELLGSLPRIENRSASVINKLPSFTVDSAEIFQELSNRPSVIVPYALAWASTLMIFSPVRVWIVLTALGGEFSHPFFLPIILVMAYSVTILPLTPGGIGVAEASATAVLVSLNMTPELVPAVIFIDRLFGVYLPALLGWFPTAAIDISNMLTQHNERE